MTELEQYITSYFGVSREGLEKITTFFHPHQIDKGEYFLKKGMPSNQLSFIKSGILRIYAPAGPREVTQWISTKGYFVTDLSSFVFGSPARWNIQALTDVDLYTINKRDYNDLGNILPQWHHLEKLFIARCFTIMEERIFNLLSLSAEERYRFFFDQYPELFNQVPLQYIASMLGMTPETFSRIRNRSLN